MKKKIWIPMISVLGIIAVLVVLGRGAISFGYMKGRCVVTDNGSYMIIDEDGCPISMSNRTEDESLFAGLKTGDKIRIKYDGIAESYPGQAGVYACKKIADGDIEDIGGDVLYDLLTMGYIGQDVLRAGETVNYMDENVSMSLQIPDGWSYEINECGDGVYGYGCGICFWPEEYSEGKIYLRYFEGGFGVCGTGLEQKDTMIAGREASIGIYENSGMWDFISFYPDVKDVAFISEGAEAWWEEYKTEATYILHSMKLETE